MLRIKGKTFFEARYILAKHYKIDYNNREWETMHLCDNPSCINLEHLMIGTNELNMLDRSNKKRDRSSKKTHCLQGHEYNHDNTRLARNGQRICRTCDRLRQVERYNRMKKNESYRASP
jgi:hypothetical protein